MSLAALPPREAGHSNSTLPLANLYNDDRVPQICSDDDDDTSILDEFLDMDEQDVERAAAAKSTTPQTTTAVSAKVHMVDVAPVLPQKSALRVSRMLDGFGMLQVQTPGSTTATVATTTRPPHDIYLSSEEDASSSADDFSDYEWDSSSEGALSPCRTSQEDTARVVSVVFSGKPSIVQLSPRHRCTTPGSSECHSRTASSASEASSASSGRRLSIASTVSSAPALSPQKAEHVLRKRPPFLKLDPFANSSTYHLDQSAQDPSEPASAISVSSTTDKRTLAKTPTQQLMKGVSRTLSLVRKKSRPMLSGHYHQSRDDLRSSSLREMRLEHDEPVPQLPDRNQARTPLSQQAPASPVVTYQEILRSARKNSVMLPQSPDHQEEHHLGSTTMPDVSSTETLSSVAHKRGILSGLAARRRSFKFTGKMNY